MLLTVQSLFSINEAFGARHKGSGGVRQDRGWIGGASPLSPATRTLLHSTKSHVLFDFPLPDQPPLMPTSYRLRAFVLPPAQPQYCLPNRTAARIQKTVLSKTVFSTRFESTVSEKTVSGASDPSPAPPRPCGAHPGSSLHGNRVLFHGNRVLDVGEQMPCGVLPPTLLCPLYNLVVSFL